jgi:hypothetical protein
MVFRTFRDVKLDTKWRALLYAVFSTFIDAELDTKRRAIFDAASAAVFRPFAEANLDTKRRAIFDAVTASVFEALFGPFVDSELQPRDEPSTMPSLHPPSKPT